MTLVPGIASGRILEMIVSESFSGAGDATSAQFWLTRGKRSGTVVITRPDRSNTRTPLSKEYQLASLQAACSAADDRA